MRVCNVCGHAVKDNATVTQCGHMFHEMCLNIWFESFSTCPTCSVPVRDFIPVVSSDEDRGRRNKKGGTLQRSGSGIRQKRSNSNGDKVGKSCDTLHRSRGNKTGWGNSPESNAMPSDILNLSVGELLASGGYGSRIIELEREISKLRMDLKFERKCRRWLEHDLEDIKHIKKELEQERNQLLLQIKDKPTEAKLSESPEKSDTAASTSKSNKPRFGRSLSCTLGNKRWVP